MIPKFMTAALTAIIGILGVSNAQAQSDQVSAPVLAGPMSLLCGGTKHLQVDLAAGTVKVGDLAPVRAEISDKYVRFSYFAHTTRYDGTSVRANLNRNDLSFEETRAVGSEPGVRFGDTRPWGTVHTKVKCVKGG